MDRLLRFSAITAQSLWCQFVLGGLEVIGASLQPENSGLFTSRQTAVWVGGGCLSVA